MFHQTTIKAGGTSAGLAIAPALQVLTWPFLIITIFMLGRGWYLELSHGSGWSSPWAKRSTLTIVLTTLLAISLWGLRFAGVLGESPF